MSLYRGREPTHGHWDAPPACFLSDFPRVPDLLFSPPSSTTYNFPLSIILASVLHCSPCPPTEDPQRHTHHFIGHTLRCHVYRSSCTRPPFLFVTLPRTLPWFLVYLSAKSTGGCNAYRGVKCECGPFSCWFDFKLYRETDIIPSGAVGRARDGEGSDNDEVAGSNVKINHDTRSTLGSTLAAPVQGPVKGPSKRVTRCASIQSVFVW